MAAVPQSTLCTECSDLDLPTKVKPPLDTGARLATLRGSHIRKSRRNCTLCAFLFDSLKLSGQTLKSSIFRRKDEMIHLDAITGDGEPGCRIELSVVDVKNDHPVTLISGLSRHGPPDTQQMPLGDSVQSTNLVSGRAIGNTVSWPLLRGWVDYCCKEHKHDMTPARQGWNWGSRFRLIDVKDRCVVGADIRSASYAALSYVCGGSEPSRLVMKNTKQLMTKGGLTALPNLPQTFKDAIYAAEQLGIAYLWIDALCIQHDDHADFNTNIHGMDQIYRAATMTMVSVTANAGSAIPGVRTGSRDSTRLRYNAPGVDIMYARPSLVSSIANSDWESRCWTLQKKVFSIRILYFTSNQVFFRCDHATWAEDAVLEPSDFKECSGASAGLGDRTQVSKTEVSSHDVRTNPPRPKRVILLESFLQYQDLLQQYLTRNLTSDKDILAAFWGIEDSFEETLGECRSGVPEVVFRAALLWYGDPYAKRRTGQPSWSWCGWVPKRSREISWLLDASAGEEGHAWKWLQDKDMPLSIVFHDPSVTCEPSYELPVDTAPHAHSLSGSNPGNVAFPHAGPEFESEDRESKFIIPLARPLDCNHPSLFYYTALSEKIPDRTLHFECDTFFGEKYIQGDAKIALKHSLDYDRKTGLGPPQNLDLLIMSASRENDSWIKRPQGTHEVPNAPVKPAKPITASVNVMLVKTNKYGSTERVWVFSIVMEGKLPDTVRKIIHLA